MNDDLNFIRIATGVSAHGLNGRLKILIISDILERFQKDRFIYAFINGFYKKYTIKDFELYKNKYGLISFDNVKDKLTADKLAGVNFFINIKEAKSGRKYLDKDSFFYFDLLDCEVYYKNELFGEIKDLLEGGSCNILVILAKNKKEYLVPFVKSMVDISKLSKKKIKIFPVSGLLEEQE